MSRARALWVLVAATTLLTGVSTISPAAADDGAPSPPTASDPCGVSQDRFFTPDRSPGEDVGWKDSAGTLYSAGEWHTTDGAASVTLTAMVWRDSGYAEYTYPPLTFDTRPDSSCVEAPDTVITQVGACNTGNGGTQVTFTYTNVDDASDLAHTRPDLQITRWDDGQHAYLVWTEGEVADGDSLSVTGGDTAVGDSVPNHIFLSPGTYTMKLGTEETGHVNLSDRLFIPACGPYKPPPGDPRGGPIPHGKPTAVIGKRVHGRVRVALDDRKSTQTIDYRLVIDPLHGRTHARVHHVHGLTQKVLVLRHQRPGTVVKVVFAGRVVQRRLR